MKKMNYFLLILTCLFTCAGHAKAKASSSQDLRSFMPDRVKSSDGSGVKMDVTQTSFFAKEKGQRYSIVRFLNMQGVCELVVLRNEGKKYIRMGETKLKFPDELNGCSYIDLKDLDGDGRLEVVVETIDGYKDQGSPAFLRWDGKRLVDISPVKTTDGAISRDLRTVAISTERDRRNLVIYDYDPDDSTSGKRVFEMVKGEVRLIGSYDLVTFIPSSGERSINPTFPADGEYTLTVKNISDHDRAVRAEVTVNGSVVLKPQDFCAAPPHKHTDKKWWFGHDDDDDHDKDNCKRCVPKSGAYATVNMKTSNEIKVHVYGRKDSKIELTLVKKQ